MIARAFSNSSTFSTGSNLNLWKKFSMATQFGLFPGLQNSRGCLAPEGFRYEEEVISKAEETRLVALLGTLELKPFEFHGHLGNRRVISFGLRYAFSKRSVEAADRLPPFLAEVRKMAANFAGIPAVYEARGRQYVAFFGGCCEKPPEGNIAWKGADPDTQGYYVFTLP